MSRESSSFTRARAGGRTFLPRVWLHCISWLGHSRTYRHTHLLFATERIHAFVAQTYRYSTFYTQITLLHSPDMARRGQFHVLPADNTYPIEDFDMIKAVAKAPECRRTFQLVS